MKKPIHGDDLIIRHQGVMLRATCNEVTETPNRGAGSAKFTIVSKARFEKGQEAHLLAGGGEIAIQVAHVTPMGHRNISIVSFHGVFDGLTPVAAAPIKSA